MNQVISRNGELEEELQRVRRLVKEQAEILASYEGDKSEVPQPQRSINQKRQDLLEEIKAQLRDKSFECDELKDQNQQMHAVVEDLQETLVQTIKTRDQFIEAVSQEHELVVKNQQTLRELELKEDSIINQIKRLNQSSGCQTISSPKNESKTLHYQQSQLQHGSRSRQHSFGMHTKNLSNCSITSKESSRNYHKSSRQDASKEPGRSNSSLSIGEKQKLRKKPTSNLDQILSCPLSSNHNK